MRARRTGFSLRLVAALGVALAACAAAAAPGVLPPPSMQPEHDLIVDPTGENPVLVAPVQSPESPEEVLPRAGDGVLGRALDETLEPTPAWYSPAYWFGSEPWNAGIELGINGSKGTNDVFSLRSGGHLKRVTPRWKLDSSIVYNKNVANGVETQNNAKLDARLDRILAETAWTLFTLDNLIYDEFQAYNTQLSINAGVGYQLAKTPALDLLARFGAGATREFGGPDDAWKPQALMGADYTHKITGTQRLSAKVDYYPEWEDFRRYRVVSDLGWTIDLDQPKNVSLKFSLIDRYDSTPNGVQPNSYDYAVLLIWGL